MQRGLLGIQRRHPVQVGARALRSVQALIVVAVIRDFVVEHILLGGLPQGLACRSGAAWHLYSDLPLSGTSPSTVFSASD